MLKNKLDVPTPTVEALAEKHKVSLVDMEAALSKGLEVELEHTTDKEVAKEIALDHLSESPEYYKELEKMEANLGDEVTFMQDRLPLPTERKFKDNGAMIAPATIARTGIMLYQARDCGAMFADRDPNSSVKIMTTAEELFAEDSLESYRSGPVTVGHPEEDVTTENSKELMKGNLEGMPFKAADGEQLACNLVLNDQETINLVESGVSQLSSGHRCLLVLADEGEDFDAKKTRIRANHVAIVPHGRANTANIADEAGEVPLIDQSMLDAVQIKLDDSVALVEDLTQKLNDALALSSKEAIANLVDEQLEFIKGAAKFSDVDVTALSRIEAKRAVLKDCLGRDFADKKDSLVELRYEILLDEGEPLEGDTGMTKALMETAGHTLVDEQAKPDEAETSRDRMISRHSA